MLLLKRTFQIAIICALVLTFLLAVPYYMKHFVKNYIDISA